MKGSTAVVLSVAILAGQALALPTEARSNEVQRREAAPEAEAGVAPATLPPREAEAKLKPIPRSEVDGADTINIRHDAIKEYV